MANIIGLSISLGFCYLIIAHCVAVTYYRYGIYKDYRECDCEDRLVAIDSLLWPIFIPLNAIGYLGIKFAKFAKLTEKNLD